MGHLYHGELLVITKLGNYYWVFRKKKQLKHPEISRGLMASGAQGAKLIGEVIDISSTSVRLDPSKQGQLLMKPGPHESMIYLAGPFFHRYVKLQQRVYCIQSVYYSWWLLVVFVGYY
jgi:hypothetical protein